MAARRHVGIAIVFLTVFKFATAAQNGYFGCARILRDVLPERTSAYNRLVADGDESRVPLIMKIIRKFACQQRTQQNVHRNLYRDVFMLMIPSGELDLKRTNSENETPLMFTLRLVNPFDPPHNGTRGPFNLIDVVGHLLFHQKSGGNMWSAYDLTKPRRDININAVSTSMKGGPLAMAMVQGTSKSNRSVSSVQLSIELILLLLLHPEIRIQGQDVNGSRLVLAVDNGVFVANVQRDGVPELSKCQLFPGLFYQVHSYTTCSIEKIEIQLDRDILTEHMIDFVDRMGKEMISSGDCASTALGDHGVDHRIHDSMENTILRTSGNSIDTDPDTDPLREDDSQNMDYWLYKNANRPEVVAMPSFVRVSLFDFFRQQKSIAESNAMPSKDVKNSTHD